MNAQKLISEISQAQKSSSLTMNRTVQIEGIRRKEITERQIFTHNHPDITNKGKNIKKKPIASYRFQYFCSCDRLQGYFQIKEILLL